MRVSIPWISLGLAVALVACKKDEPASAPVPPAAPVAAAPASAPAAPSAPAAAPKPAAELPPAALPTGAEAAAIRDAFMAVWRGLPESKNGCPNDFDYFPDGGMRNLSCHARTLLGWQKLAALFGRPVFRAGPHGKLDLVLDAQTDFGRYDPSFPAWLAAMAIPSADQKALIETMRPIYEKYVHRIATVYLTAHLYLRDQPELRARARAELETYMKEPGRHRPLHERYDGANGSDTWNAFGPAVSFWIRRDLDGSAAGFLDGLRALIGRWEPELLARMEREGWRKPRDAEPIIPSAIGDPGAPTAPAAGGGAARPKDLAGAVEAAWLGVVGWESACPGVFNYVPGGLRVTYCRLLHAASYADVVGWAPFPPFKSGPHTAGRLDLEQRSSFGHYDPRFVDWLVDRAIPGAKDAAFRARTQGSYDGMLRVPARCLFYARRFLAEDPRAADMRKAYDAWIEGKGDSDPRWSWWEMMPGEYEPQTIISSGVAFWMRREKDGTADRFAAGLEKLLSAYDADFLRSARGRPWEALRDDGALFGDPAADDPPVEEEYEGE